MQVDILCTHPMFGPDSGGCAGLGSAGLVGQQRVGLGRVCLAGWARALPTAPAHSLAPPLSPRTRPPLPPSPQVRGPGLASTLCMKRYGWTPRRPAKSAASPSSTCARPARLCYRNLPSHPARALQRAAAAWQCGVAVPLLLGALVRPPGPSHKPPRHPPQHTRTRAQFFAAEGCRMVEMSCEEHDQLAASTQFITHTVGRMLGAMQARAAAARPPPVRLPCSPRAVLQPVASPRS